MYVTKKNNYKLTEILAFLCEQLGYNDSGHPFLIENACSISNCKKLERKLDILLEHLNLEYQQNCRERLPKINKINQKQEEK